MASQAVRAVLKLKPHIPLIKFRGKLAEHPAPAPSAPSTSNTTTTSTSGSNNVISTTMTSLFKRPLLSKEALEIIQVKICFYLQIISYLLLIMVLHSLVEPCPRQNKDKKNFLLP